MSKIVVTGAAGFLGSSFCHWLIENTEHTVFGIDNLSGGCIHNLPKESDRFYFYDWDIRETYRLFETISPEACFHLAAYASEGRSNNIRYFINSNNTLGAANVVNNCVNYNCKLIFTSSVAVYSGQPPFDENTVANPVDEYGLSKLMTEKSIEIAAQEQGLKYCIVRPRNVYGERQNIYDASRNLFGIWSYNVLTKRPLLIFGDGNNKRSFTYIDDILEPLYHAIEIDNQSINLGAETVYTLNEAAQIFSEITGYKNIVHVDERREVKEAYCDTEKSKRFLGFKEQTSLKEGLTKMWDWAKNQEIKPQIEPPRLEVFKTNHSSIK